MDVEIKCLSILSEHPKLYKEFAELGCAGSLVSLLTHENTDISIDAIEILGELIDEDVEAEEDQWDAIANSMVRRTPCSNFSFYELTISSWTRIYLNFYHKISHD